MLVSQLRVNEVRRPRKKKNKKQNFNKYVRLVLTITCRLSTYYQFTITLRTSACVDRSRIIIYRCF